MIYSGRKHHIGGGRRMARPAGLRSVRASRTPSRNNLVGNTASPSSQGAGSSVGEMKTPSTRYSKGLKTLVLKIGCASRFHQRRQRKCEGHLRTVSEPFFVILLCCPHSSPSCSVRPCACRCVSSCSLSSCSLPGRSPSENDLIKMS